MWRSGPEEILLACSRDVLPPTLKRLSMFVLRAKCKLSDASAELQLCGLTGPAAAQWLGSEAPSSAWRTASAAGGHALRLPDVDGLERYLWCAPRELPAPDLPGLPQEAWSWLDVRSGIARITAATVERFVPQMVNFELVAGVNFRKGCYPGQEVVARSQYRGTIKRRSFLFETDVQAHPGQEVFQENDDPSQPAGMVVNAASFGGRHAALVEVKLAALDGPRLCLGAPGGATLQRVPLPYDVPLEATA
jgi:folate-binding protein YgfZ